MIFQAVVVIDEVCMVSQCVSMQMFAWLADASWDVAFILLTFLGQVLVIHLRKLAG